MIYDLDGFLSQCNLTPLLKKYRKEHGDITASTLKRNGLYAKKYSVNDLLKVEKKLTGFQLPEEPSELKIVEKKKRSIKDLRHKSLIQKIDNQRFVMKIREDLNMPFNNRGFLIKDPSGKKPRGPILCEHYTNMTFEFSLEYKKWFFGNSKRKIEFDEREKATITKSQQISSAVNKILNTWKLPKRYEPAIRELLLFNRIIPASSGISWSRIRKNVDGEWAESITYDSDTSKKELIETIEQDQYGIFKNKKKHLLGGKNVRKKRKAPETYKMLKYYNKERAVGVTKKRIYEALSREYGISSSAVRKRLLN